MRPRLGLLSSALAILALLAYLSMGVALLAAILLGIGDAVDIVRTQEVLPAAIQSSVYVLAGLIPATLALASARLLLRCLLMSDPSVLSHGTVRRVLLILFCAFAALGAWLLSFFEPDLGDYDMAVSFVAEHYAMAFAISAAVGLGAAIVVHFARRAASNSNKPGGSLA